MHIGVVYFGRKRPGFDQEWGRHIEIGVQDMLAGADYDFDYVTLPVVDEATLNATLESMAQAAVDAIVVLQPTMSDGRLMVRFAQRWQKPVVLWATPERTDTSKVSSCSLVGTHVFAANLRQHNLPFELVYGAPEAPETRADLDTALRVVHACVTLSQAKVGLIGYHAPGFLDMHADPFDLSGHFGAQLWHTGLHELLERIASVPEESVKDAVDAVLALNLPMDRVEPEDLAQDARFYCAVKTLFEEENLDALALREWPELPNLTGHWPYLAIARLLDEGLPIACEGDVDGALTSLVGCLLGFGPGYLSDWLAHDADTITLWHGGCAPLGMCASAGDPGAPRIGRHFNSDKPAVVNAVLPAGMDLSLCRIWRCDGAYQMMIQETTTIEPVHPLDGTVARVRMQGMNVHEWFRDLCHGGMPHHIVAFPGHHAHRLQRFARLAELDIFV